MAKAEKRVAKRREEVRPNRCKIRWRKIRIWCSVRGVTTEPVLQAWGRSVAAD